MLKIVAGLTLFCCLGVFAPQAGAAGEPPAKSPRPVEIVDDSGAAVRLPAPARRMMFAR